MNDLNQLSDSEIDLLKESFKESTMSNCFESASKLDLRNKFLKKYYTLQKRKSKENDSQKFNTISRNSKIENTVVRRIKRK